MAKPNKKQPTKTVDIYCSKCRCHLFKYRKGGKGALVKCFKERIVTSYVTTSCHCPNCNTQFARETVIKGVPAYKTIGGKVLMK